MIKVLKHTKGEKTGMMKKMFAFLLAAAMLMALCGCGTEVEAYGETAVAVEETAQPAAEAAAPEQVATVATESAAPAEPLDFDAAYAAYAPETVVFTVEGEEVTWQEFFYEIAYNASIIAAQEGAAFTDWDEMCPLYVDADGNMVFTYGDVVLQYAVNALLQYHIMDKHMTELGIVLDEDSIAMLEDVRQQIVDTNFSGDEGAFLNYLESLYCSDELWNWFNETDAKYAQAFDDLYGEMGSNYTDENVMAYAAGDPDGAWTEYVQLKMICLYAEEEAEAEETSEEPASDEPSEEAAELSDADLAAQILAELSAAEDRNARYAELYTQYNEEIGLDPYPDGWCVYQGDIAQEVYSAALTMEPDEMRVVSIEDGEVVVWKVPVDPDAGVTYDSANNTVYTLRYYAAWQEYAETVNQWLETGTATAQWAEGFENFSLNSVFA